MSLPPIIQALKDSEQTYEPSSITRQALSHKVLTTLIAPTAVGKSTLIKRVIELGGDDFSESYSVVTRARRPTDPTHYKTRDEGYTIERVTDMINAHELTHYTIFPSGQIYGSLPESFSTQYSLLPCVPTILNVVRRAGFLAVHPIYIVTSAHDWAERLPERRGDTSYKARLEEAVESLTWSISHTDELVFVENASGKLDEAANTILQITMGQGSPPDIDHGLSLAYDMLAYAKQELAAITS
jgi:hypothetical protein